MRIVIYLMFFLASFHISAQVELENYSLEDRIYNSDIKSVTFSSLKAVGTTSSSRIANLPIPIVLMGNRITWSFDELTQEQRFLEYAIVHCNRNWEISSRISEFDYLDGFSTAYLRDSDISRTAITPYTSYQLTLPNDDMGWLISGNYVLFIWDTDTNEMLLSRRFVVMDRVLSAQAEITSSLTGNNRLQAQEVKLEVAIPDAGIDNPVLNLHANIYQDYDWKAAHENLSVVNQDRDNLSFYLPGRSPFKSIKQYRIADLRSVFFSGFGIKFVENQENGYFAAVNPGLPLGEQMAFYQDVDQDGGFTIMNTDDPSDDPEYVELLFTYLPRDPSVEKDIYVLGKFNDYRQDEGSKMIFDAKNKLYYKKLILKQGVYNYAYSISKEADRIDYEEAQGYDARSSHIYTAIIYYRDLSKNYDQAIGFGITEGIATY